MRTKPRDILYCGCDADLIRSTDVAVPIDRLTVLRSFIIDRYNIHLLKDVDKAEDIYSLVSSPVYHRVFEKFKFCNVRREQDRQSRWLTEHISNNLKLTLEDRVYKSILYRLYNNLVTADLIHLGTAPILGTDQRFNSYVDRCAGLMPPVGNGGSYSRYFTNAYNTTGFKKALNRMYSRELSVEPILMVRDMYIDGLYDRMMDCSDQQEVFSLLNSLMGIGVFLAYQLYVDLTYIDEFPFSENEFVIAGPGCHYGLEILLGGEQLRMECPLSDSELLFWLRDNLVQICARYGLPLDCDHLFRDLPEYDRCLNVMSLENCLCELQKFYRVLDSNDSNPRVHYHPFRS